VVAVNKMDLVDYCEGVFERIRADFLQFAAQLQAPDLYFIPVSALHGDNIVAKSERMTWFEGASLLHYLETVHISSDRNLSEMRFPVQLVMRPNQQFRGYAGQVASGVLKPGDPVLVLPSGRTSRVKSIVTYDGELARAFPPMSVTVRLEDELDVSRGNMLAPPSRGPDTGANETLRWRKGIRIGSARTGKVTAFIEDMELVRADHSGAEGIAVDSEGNVYGAVVPRNMLEKHVLASK
jgi:bifunctional enzyme CysN/CysC